MPVSQGERIFGRWEYVNYFLGNSVQVIQPDIGNAGGITETKKLCDMAYVFDVGVQVHTCASHLLTPPSVQLEACIPSFVIHEQPESGEPGTDHEGSSSQEWIPDCGR